MVLPATPLALSLGVALGLLIASLLSAPIIKEIPLAKHKGVTFGVFGYCTEEKCTGFQIGYDAGALFADDPQAFDLPEGARNATTSILIVHAVAAAFTLILFIMAIWAHFRAAAHSSRFLLFTIIFVFVDLVICLFAFLVDVVTFVPRLAWGSYLVLAATILLCFAAIVSCTMRRTLSSRKNQTLRMDKSILPPDQMERGSVTSMTLKPQPSLAREPLVPNMDIAATPRPSDGYDDKTWSSPDRLTQKMSPSQTHNNNFPLQRNNTFSSMEYRRQESYFEGGRDVPPMAVPGLPSYMTQPKIKGPPRQPIYEEESAPPPPLQNDSSPPRLPMAYGSPPRQPYHGNNTTQSNISSPPQAITYQPGVQQAQGYSDEYYNNQDYDNNINNNNNADGYYDNNYQDPYAGNNYHEDPSYNNYQPTSMYPGRPGPQSPPRLQQQSMHPYKQGPPPPEEYQPYGNFPRNPPPGQHPPPQPRAPKAKNKQDVLFNNNPDFELSRGNRGFR